MKANFLPRCCVDKSGTDRNIAHTKTLGLPYTEERERGCLAVVGGGNSIIKHIEELRNFDGDVWASGSAFHWCVAHGIEATYFCIDPGEYIPELVFGAKKAILSTCSDASAFELLDGADIKVFDLIHNIEEANHGVTSITAVPQLALSMGYRDVTFYGVDSCYAETADYAYEYPGVPNYRRPLKMKVKVGYEVFLTDPELFMQAELMAHVIRMCPKIYKEKSGGLLRAMVADLDYDIIWLSDDLLAIKE